MGVPKSLGKSRHKHHPKVRGPVSGNLVGILDGCVLHLPMDEGFGDTVHDRSGYGNHGTIYGASWVWDDELGRYMLSFDGDDYVGDLNVPVNNSSFTVFFSFRAPAQDYLGFVAHASDNYNLYSDYPSLTDILYCGWNEGGWQELQVSSFSRFLDNSWHYVLWCWNGSQGRVYVDGTLEDSRTLTPKSEQLYLCLLYTSPSPRD